MIVEYTFVKYIATGKLPAETRTVEIKPNADYSNKNYSYKLTEIGEYTNFSVRVSRKGTAASAKVSGEKPGDLDFVFDIYAYGLGVDGDLYGIKTVEHLSNIKYYPSAKFELGGNVNIETLFTSIESSGSALICEEFTGYLNGNGNALRFGENVTQYNLNLQNVTNIALFKKLNGATIENISYGEETLTVNIVDEFSISEELKLALIAQEAVHATMKQVSIKNVNITVLTQGVTIANRIKIAGMFAESNSATNIQNCHVGLTVNMQADFDSNFNVYIASTVATAQNTTIGYTTANFALTSSVYKQLYAVGGLVAEMTATTTGYGVHDSSSVEVDIDNVVAKSVGGVVGRTSSVTVTNCTVSGTIKYTNIDYKIDIGGIVGIMDASTVTSCTVNINFEITVYASQSQYLGVIAGNTGANSTIEKCATTVKPCGQRTTISNGVVNYGIYGYKGSGSNVGTITIK